MKTDEYSLGEGKPCADGGDHLWARGNPYEKYCVRCLMERPVPRLSEWASMPEVRTHHHPRVWRSRPAGERWLAANGHATRWNVFCPECGALGSHAGWRAAFTTALRHAEEHLS